MKNIFKFLKIQDGIGEPPWEYAFLYNLSESEYPKYLAKIFKYRTGKNLNLKHPKTFNEKIQWIKLYGVTDLMRKCTDKVAVRDYVKNKIGEEYLKPVLQIILNESHETVRCHCEQVNDNLGLARQSTDGSHDILDCRADNKMSLSARNDGELDDVSTYFDKINFDKLPNAFVIKCNHGCKWQYIIKDKNLFLDNKRMFDIVKRNITGWLEQDYSFWNGFEMQYHSITPKILIEPFIYNEINKPCEEMHVYCFNGIPKFAVKQFINGENIISVFDEKLNHSDKIFSCVEKNVKINTGKPEKQMFDLSEQLSRDFAFARVDWMLYQEKIYFEEITFTPLSGFGNIINQNFNEILGKLINI